MVLADEINRATPRTQSALLEAMAEGEITIDNDTLILEKPFFVMATQNPIETHGTFILPEAQLDRFFMRIKMGYPDMESELKVLKLNYAENPIEKIEAVMNKEDILYFQKLSKDVYISEDLEKYIINIANATRNNDKIRLGLSPRGSVALMKASKSNAILDSRDYVIPDDVKKMAPFVLNHRIIPNRSGLFNYEKMISLVGEIVDSIETPVEKG